MPSRAPGATPPAVCSHAVEFYEDRAKFLDRLSDFIRSAINSGGACLVIATEANRQGLAQRLRASGLDLSRAVQKSQYLLLDAEATLARFMIDGWPDREAFFASIEPQLMHAKNSLGPDVKFPVAFGEMVALLWNDGNRDAALRLEQLWNELARAHDFALRCAYPRECFASQIDQDYMTRICAEHSHVL
jgi:hypothetical protein